MEPNEHTYTRDELERELRNAHRRRPRTDAIVAQAAEQTRQLAEANQRPDYVAQRLRAIIAGG